MVGNRSKHGTRRRAKVTWPTFQSRRPPRARVPLFGRIALIWTVAGFLSTAILAISADGSRNDILQWSPLLVFGPPAAVLLLSWLRYRGRQAWLDRNRR